MTAAELEAFAKQAQDATEKLERDLAISCLLEAAKQLLVQVTNRDCELVARRQDARTLLDLQADLTTALEKSHGLLIQALGNDSVAVKAELTAPPASPLRLVRTGCCPVCGALIGSAHSFGCSIGDRAEGQPRGA